MGANRFFIQRACWTWLRHVARMHIPALPKLALWGWPASSEAGSRRRLSKEHSHRLRSWKKGSPLPIPPPKRVRRFDATPPTTSLGPTFFLSYLQGRFGLGCSIGCSLQFFSRNSRQSLGDKALLSAFSLRVGFSLTKWHLRNHSRSSGDKLLSVRQVGSIASTVRKPQPAHWLIAPDGSASPSSVEQPASAGWGFVVKR